MNRKYNLLLSCKYPNITTIDELIDYLDCSVKDSVHTLPYGSKNPSLTSLLIYLCGYASVRELQFLVGPVCKSMSLNITRLLGTGALEKFSLPITDLGSYTAYHVTDLGYASYLSGVSDDLKEGGGVRLNKRRTAQKSIKGTGSKETSKTVPLVPMHDYGVGISLLSLLMLRRAISVSKEVSFHSGAGITTSGKMRSDAWIDLSGSRSSHTATRIFLEQDMGTESTRKIVNKLFAYGESRYLDPAQNCIILSCYAPSGALKGGRFDRGTILQLLALLTDWVNAGGPDDLFALYENAPAEALPLSHHELESLLLSVEAASRCGMSKFIRKPGNIFTSADLQTYAEQLEYGNNPCYEKSVNIRLMLLSKKSFRSLCLYLHKVIFENAYTTSFFARALFGGYSAFVLPSTLLSNSAPFFMRTDGAGRLDHYVSSISGYLPDLKDYILADGTGATFQLQIRVKQDQDSQDGIEHIAITFPNAFYSLNGSIVCLEHLGRDLGAFVRLVALGRAINREELHDVHVIAICDSIDDANSLTRLIKPMPFIRRADGKPGFRFNFLFEHTCTGDGNSPLLEFNRPFDPMNEYLDTSLRFENRPKQPNATVGEIFAFTLSEFN